MKTGGENTQKYSQHGFFRSSYHRHFEGYAEYEAVDERGVAIIRRVYTGIYYIPELDRKQMVRHRWIQIGLWVAAWAVFIFGASRQGSGNSTWYVGLCQAVDIAVFVWIGSGLFNYLIASPKMTVGEWRSSAQRVKHGSICALASTVATGLMTVLNLILTGEEIAGHLISAVCFVLAALCMAVSCMNEQRIVYKKVLSEENAPGFAAQIR